MRTEASAGYNESGPEQERKRERKERRYSIRISPEICVSAGIVARMSYNLNERAQTTKRHLFCYGKIESLGNVFSSPDGYVFSPKVGYFGWQSKNGL